MEGTERASARRSPSRLLASALWFTLLTSILMLGWMVVRAQFAEFDLQPRAVGSARHVNEPVAYGQTPPTKGDHHPIWWDCGVYDAPIPFEHAVHSLEHGAVWITHRSELTKSAQDTLAGMADRGYLLISPLPEQSSAIVVTAWDVQLRLEEVDVQAIADFVVEHRLSPRAPDAGALCSNGTREDLVQRG